MKFEKLKKIFSVILSIALLTGFGALAEQTEATGEAAETETEDYGDPTADMDTFTLQQEVSETLEDVEETESVAATGEVINDSDVFNVLLIGTDERANEYSDDARGDCCMLFSVNQKNGDVKLVSFERGMGVPILDGQYEGQWDWLTHTFKYGGAELMVREISENFNLNISGYVRVNLNSFVEAIDAIGGVDIELTKAEAEYINGDFGHETAADINVQDNVITASEGMNHLNGASAMVFARCRKIDSDWSRIERQRKVIIAVMENLQSKGADEIVALLNELLPLVKTNIDAASVTAMIAAVPNLLGGNIEQMTIPQPDTYGSKKGMGGRSMYSINFDEAAKTLNDFLYGESAN